MGVWYGVCSSKRFIPQCATCSRHADNHPGSSAAPVAPIVNDQDVCATYRQQAEPWVVGAGT
jgi:hypothetical protein